MRGKIVIVAVLAALAVVPRLPAQVSTVEFHKQRMASRPGDVDAMRMLADALVARAERTANGADYEEASAVLDQCDRMEPWHAPVVLSRARLLLSRHRFLAARGLAEEGARRFPSEARFHEVASDGALETGDLEGAERHARILVEQKPNLPAWARLAHVYEIREDWQRAIEYQTKALEDGLSNTSSAPPESLAWCRAILGELYLKSGNGAEARRQYEQGLAESPAHPLVLEHLAELERREGHPEKAAEAYRAILKTQRNPVIEIALAGITGDAELLARAEAFLVQAVESGNEGYLRPLAQIRLRQGRFEQAAALQVRDVLLRPVPDACAVLHSITGAARKAGATLSVSDGICGQNSSGGLAAADRKLVLSQSR